MNQKLNAPKENRHRISVSLPTGEKTNAKTIIDNRPRTVSQRKLKEIMNQGKGSSETAKAIQKKTKITHTSRDFTYNNDQKDKVGVEMEAYLDPHDIVVGSETGTPQKALYDAVNVKTPSGMVRGHLLNHDLGGYGVAENLYPITSSANSKHKFYVENPVQKELTKAQKNTTTIEHNSNTGKGIYYHVAVGNLQLKDTDLVNNPVSFICTAKKLTNVGTGSEGTQGEEILQTTVTSDTKGATSGDRGQVKDTVTGKEPKTKETIKTVPAGWEHGTRKGSENFLDKIKEGKIVLVDGDIQSQGNTSTVNQTSVLDRKAAVIDEIIANVSEVNLMKYELVDLKKKLDPEWLESLSKDFDYTYAKYLADMVNRQIQMYNADTEHFWYGSEHFLEGIMDNLSQTIFYYHIIITKYSKQ